MKQYKEIKTQQGSPEWIIWRKNHITATDTSKILSCNPWTSALDCYNEKINGKTTPLNAAMKRGQELEIQARAYLEQRDGVQYTPKCFESTEHGFMAASLDAVSNDNSIGKEIKCPQEKAMTKALKGNYDKYYEWQCQKQMLVMGWQEIELFYYHNDYINKGFIIKRDEKKIKKIIKAETDFLNNHILPKMPPESNERKLEKLDDYAINELALQLRDAIVIEREAARTKKAIEEDLKALVGARDCFMVNAGMKHIIIEKKGTIDTTKLYNDYGISEDEAESYRKKSTTYSKFTIVS